MGNRVVEACCNPFESSEPIKEEHKIVKVPKTPEFIIERSISPDIQKKIKREF